MPGKKVACQYCSKVMRSDNLKNHVKIHNRKRGFSYESKDYGNQINMNSGKQESRQQQQQHVIENQQLSDSKKEEIPTFDSDEFSSKKPKSRETIYKMMEMLNIPDHRKETICTKILKEDQERLGTILIQTTTMKTDR